MEENRKTKLFCSAILFQLEKFEENRFRVGSKNFVSSEILFELHSGKKSESNLHILKDDFRKLQNRRKNYQQIYNNESKEDSKVGCAVRSDNHSNMQPIPDDSPIFMKPKQLT